MPLLQTVRGAIWYADHRCPEHPNTPVLFIHGAGSNHLDWPGELRRMPEANALLPDLPGHGKSPLPGRDSVDEYAADLLALLDALQLEKVIAAGHSMGGAIALTMALAQPQRIAGLILIGTSAHFQVNALILDGIRSDPANTVNLLLKWEWAKGVEGPAREENRQRMLETAPEVTYGDYVACSRFDLRERLSEIRPPALVIGGEVDKMAPYALSMALADALPNVELVKIDGGGHMMMLEQPEKVADVMRGWLQDR